MSPTLLRHWLLACCLLLPGLAPGAAPPSLQEKATALALADSPYWRLLLRYEPARTASGWRSEARSAHFFLSPAGREHPAQELAALLDALHADEADPEKAAFCRFPARTAWLQQQLQFIAPTVDCPVFQDWKAAINPAQATLVFASDYLNNPSSMFGHTFLRLDAPEQTEDTRLLAYAVNYAANAPDTNPLTFAWKGLSGGYPGVFSLMPYYDKVKEYSDMENRDLWEYQLSFTSEELQRLLDHLWELRSVEFPYYFLTRNCSFQLLSLFEVARPGLALRDAFPLQAIPSDTVRRVLQEPGLLRKLVYRPSAQRRLLVNAAHHPAALNRAARRLAREPDTMLALAPEQAAAALESAYDYRYYRFMAGEQADDARQALRTLLLHRAALPVPDQRQAPPQPKLGPAQGHATARLALALGNDRDATYLGLRLRPAYHDLLDPPGGYRQGAHIDFLDTELRLDDKRQRLRLERFSVVDIDSLASWDTYFRPWSWFFGFGYRQAAIDREGHFSTTTSHGVAFADGGAGISVGLDERLNCYLLAAAATEAGRELQDGWRIGAGPRAGCLYGLPFGRLRLQTDGRYFDDIGALESRTTVEAQVDVGSTQGLRFLLGERRAGGQQRSFGEVIWLRYF